MRSVACRNEVHIESIVSRFILKILGNLERCHPMARQALSESAEVFAARVTERLEASR